MYIVIYICNYVKLYKHKLLTQILRKQCNKILAGDTNTSHELYTYIYVGTHMYASVFVTSNNKVRIGLHLRLHECGSKIPKQFEIGRHRSGDAFQFVHGKKGIVSQVSMRSCGIL